MTEIIEIHKEIAIALECGVALPDSKLGFESKRRSPQAQVSTSTH